MYSFKKCVIYYGQGKTMTLKIDGVYDLYEDFDKFIRVNDRAIADAMNRGLLAGATASLGRKEGMRHDWVGIKASDLKRYTHTTKARAGSLSAQFTVVSRPIDLIDFGAVQKKKGVSYRLKHKRRTMKKTWIMPSKFGTKQDQVFARTEARPKRATRRASITPTSMYIEAEADDLFVKRFLEVFEKRYLQQVDYLMKK